MLKKRLEEVSIIDTSCEKSYPKQHGKTILHTFKYNTILPVPYMTSSLNSNIAEILLKVALNTKIQIQIQREIKKENSYTSFI